MSVVSTYVFIDLETTGLPKEECNRTKITEISMVAVKRQHLLDTRAGETPRVQHKLTLCFNPRRLVTPTVTDVTGLSNDLLDEEPVFDTNTFDIINTFLNVLTEPVCLIAQNGLNFDYPIFKQHIEKQGKSLSENLLCADSYHGFYDILEPKKKAAGCQQKNIVFEDKYVPENSSNVLLTPKKQISMQSLNENTPKQQMITSAHGPSRMVASKARRRMPWGDGPKPSESYKLKNIYERVLNRPGIEAHRAENDCLMTLETSAALAREFVQWVDNNCVPFSEIRPMTIGVPLGQ